MFRLLLAGVLFVASLRLCAAPAAADKVVLNKTGEYHLLTARYGAALAVHGENIYVLGGASEGAIADIERFNTRTHQVDRVYDRLLPRRLHRAVEFGGKIYIFGGQGQKLATEAVGLEPALEIYDIATNTVKLGPPMPTPRFSPAVARLGDKVIVSGGGRVKDTHLSQTNATEILDLATTTWSQGVPMPTPREAPAVLVGNFVMVAGGFRGTTRSSEVEFFVPQENAWKQLPPLSERVSAHSAATLGKYLLLFGDYSNLDSVLAYDLSTRRTLKAQAKFTGVRHSAAVVVGDTVYVIGGVISRDGRQSVNLIQAFTLAEASAAGR